MSSDQELTQFVRSWIGEGVDVLPDHVLHSVLTQLPTTRQRRPGWRSWGTVSGIASDRFLRLAAVGVAIALVVAAGLGIYLDRPGVGDQPSSVPITPAPPPASTAIPTPTPGQPGATTALHPRDAGRPLAAGRYEVAVGFVGQQQPRSVVDLSLPAGWSLQAMSTSEASLVGPDGAHPYLGFFEVSRVYADPCHPERGAAGDHIGPLFANELEQDLAALTGFTVSAPEASTIDGLPATRFSISNTIDTNSAGCTVEDQLPLFETTEGLPSPVTTGGSTLQVWVVNLGRSPLLIIGDPGEPGPSAGQTGIDEAIASITVVNGTPTPSSPLSNPPTPTAEAATLDRIDVDRPLEGGTYQLAVRRPDADAQVSSFNVTLPAGWILQALRTSEAWFSGGDGERPYLGFFDVSEVYRDPCHPENGYAGHLGSWLVSDFESALGALPGFTASAPEDVTIDGHPASRFFISNAINTDAAGCTGGDTLTLLRTSQGRPALATTGGSTLEIWAVKRNSPSPSQSLPAMLIVADVGQATPALDQAAIDAIVSSITFGL